MTTKPKRSVLYRLFVGDMSTLLCVALLAQYLGWEPWYDMPVWANITGMSVMLVLNLYARFDQFRKDFDGAIDDKN